MIPFPPKTKGASISHRRVGEFSSALTHLLVKTKLDDDILDDRSWNAWLLNRLFRKKFEKCGQYFKGLDPTFENTLGDYLQEHRNMELERPAIPLDEYTRPTANAFNYVFSLLGKALDDTKWNEIFASIGERVGKAIIFADCAYDWTRDMKKGLYNPVRSLEESAHAIAASQAALREGALIAKQAFGDKSVTEQIFLGVHDRLYRAAERDQRYREYLVPLRECASSGGVEEKRTGMILAANAACPALILFAQGDPEPQVVNTCLGCLLAGCGCVIACTILKACRNNCNCCDGACQFCCDCGDGCSEAEKTKSTKTDDTFLQDRCESCCDGCSNACDKADQRRALEHYVRTGKDTGGGCC